MCLFCPSGRCGRLTFFKADYCGVPHLITSLPSGVDPENAYPRGAIGQYWSPTIGFELRVGDFTYPESVWTLECSEDRLEWVKRQ